MEYSEFHEIHEIASSLRFPPRRDFALFTKPSKSNVKIYHGNRNLSTLISKFDGTQSLRGEGKYHRSNAVDGLLPKPSGLNYLWTGGRFCDNNPLNSKGTPRIHGFEIAVGNL
jgi:hypothetical protein